MQRCVTDKGEKSLKANLGKIQLQILMYGKVQSSGPITAMVRWVKWRQFLKLGGF